MTNVDPIRHDRLLEVPAGRPDLPGMRDLIHAFVWPSEAFWRHFELDVLRGQLLERPALELGCADGGFSELAGLFLDEAIDLNPRAVAVAQTRTNVYGHVRYCDMREMAGHVKVPVRTIFANSVLEHVPAVEDVLNACAKLLVPGGQLVTTVPLRSMNDHLLLKSSWYAEFRRRQLKHHNLWSLAEWCEVLRTAGFARISHIGYLTGEQCRFWDTIDVLGTLGIGRYRVAAALRRVVWPRLPMSIRNPVARSIATRLSKRVTTRRPGASSPPCAALLVATTSDTNPPSR